MNAPYYLISEAVLFATGRHLGQMRKSPPGAPQRPYILHPLDVMSRLVAAGVSDESVLAAAVLHDTLEDTNTTEAELASRFGDEVAAIVVEVTDPKHLSKTQARKRQIVWAVTMSPKAQLVKLADKLSNVNDIVMHPPGWKPEAVLGYVEHARKVVEAMPDKHPLLFVDFERACLLAEQVGRRPVDLYLKAMDELREERSKPGWLPHLDRPLLAQMDEWYDEMSASERDLVESQGERCWPKKV